MFLNKHPYTRYKRINTRWKNINSKQVEESRIKPYKGNGIRI